MANSRLKKEHGNKIKVAQKYVRDMMRLLSKKEYELNLPTNAKDVALKVLKFVHNPSHRSHANGYVIKINLGARWHYGRPQFTEYCSFAKDPVIGTIKTDSAWDELLVVVAHELSHFIEDRYSWRIPRFRRIKDNGHGYIFKSIYRYLRRDFVNKKINTEYTSHGVWDLPVKEKAKVIRKDYKMLCELVSKYNDDLVRIIDWEEGEVAVYKYVDYCHDSDDTWEFFETFFGRGRHKRAYDFARDWFPKIQLPMAYRQ